MPLKTAAELWNSLNSGGRLAPKSHDRQFIADLRAQLHIPALQDVGAYLKQHDVDITTFLIAVLNALQPFSMMLTDIYEMFTQGGVSRSNEQLLIEFDFNEGDKLSFDADAFRRARNAIENLHNVVAQRAYKPEDLIAISRGLQTAFAETLGIERARAAIAAPIASNQATAWINNIDWPYQTPAPLPTGAITDPLSQALLPVATMVDELCRRTGRYTSQGDLRSARRDDEPQMSERAPIRQWSESTLAHAQDDHIARFQLLRMLWYYQRVPQSHRGVLADRVEALVNAHSELVAAKASYHDLEDLLDLPIWKHRSQLYSIWLVTLIKREVEQGGERFQLVGVNNCLTFAFSPTHVANLHVGNDVLELMAELRVAAQGIALMGTGRKENIQPDYSLLQRRADGSHCIIYVLEAKQYARANTRNFNQALRDYAKLNTEALVALANYGPVPTSQPQKLLELCRQAGDVNVSERCEAFACVTPTNADSARQLRKHLRRAITDYALPLPKLIVDVSSSMADVLTPQAYRDWPSTAQSISNSGMELILADSYQTTVRSGEPVRQAMLNLFETAVHGPLQGIYDITRAERGALMLFTDQSGFHEVINYRDDLAGIIVLQPNASLVIHMNKNQESLLRRAIQKLIAHCSIGESY